MAISEATALARAAAVRANFPKGPINIDQAIDMLMAVAESQVGYASSSAQWSMYGKGKNWRTEWGNRQVYWCALGLSWAFEQAFGAEAAKAGIGLQAAAWSRPPAGWTATWTWLDWFRSGGRWVGIKNCQRGDVSMQFWGRTKNATDHVELVSGRKISPNAYPTIGFNTATGNVTAGAGVQKAVRYRAQTVGIYRPNWEALVLAYNAGVVVEAVEDLTQHAEALGAFGFPATPEGVGGYQRLRSDAPHYLVVDKKFGPKTRTALEADMATLEDIAAEQARQTAQLEAITAEQGRQTAQLKIIEWAARLAANRAFYQGPSKVITRLTSTIRDAVKASQGDRDATVRLDAAQAQADQELAESPKEDR